MKIERIHIDSFMGTHDRDIEFLTGVNILRGDNESGKSTVAEFIKFMLYGASSRGEGGEMAERLKFLSFGESTFGGRMEVATKSGRFGIDRRIDRTQSGAFRESVSVTDLNKKVQVFKGENTGEALLGVPESIFKKVAYISQENEAQTGGGELGSAIENLLFSADETVSTDKALKKLDSLRVSLLHKNGKGGLLYECAAEREALEARLEKAKSDNVEIIAKEGSLADTFARIEENETEHQRCKKLCQLYDNYLAFTRFKKADGLSESLEKLAERENELEGKFAGFVPDSEYLGRLRKTKEQLSECREGIAAARVNYDSATAKTKIAAESVTDSGDTERLDAGAKQISRVRTAGKTFTVLGIFFSLAAIVIASLVYLMKYDSAIYAVAVAMLVLGIAAVLFGIAFRTKLRSALTTYGVTSEYELIEKSKELTAASTASRDAHASAKENESAAKALLENEEKRYAAIESEFALEAEKMGYGADSAKELFCAVEEYIAERESLEKQKRDTLAKLEQIKGDNAAYDREHVEKILSAVSDISVFENVDISEYSRKRDFLENAISALEIKKSELEKSLAALRATAENPSLISATLDELAKKENAAKEKYKAAELAMRAIESASAGLRTRISPRLAEYAGKLLSVMTGGKYSEIGVDGEMAMTFLKDGTAHDIAYLSKGTRESAYLALRLALADLVSKEEKLPLILDECFAHADDDRTKQTLRVLFALAADDVQSVVMTCHTREEKIADSLGVVNLIEM